MAESVLFVVEGVNPEKQVLSSIGKQFFDYEGQATNASDTALADMLAHFNNETEYGKLYVSYPMVEALKHLNHSEPFEDCMVPAGITGAQYKPLVDGYPDFQDLRKITAADWMFIIEANIKKANLIAEGAYALPSILPDQSDLLGGQLQRYKIPMGNIAVISAFPLFLRDYFGESILG